MPKRLRTVLSLSLALAFVVSLLPATALGGSGTPKVAIIVGPTGSITSSYRTWANAVAVAAEAAGASVTKVYSPNATWPNVRAAVTGANVIVYFGHGNGFPNPYGSSEWTDRANGWGLNTATTNGDADSWSAGTLVYCGEKALLGTLTASDGSAQWNSCGGSTDTDGISPAPGFVMVYAQAHYAPGFGERYSPSDPLTSLAEAQARVRNYSYPVLALGASAFFATAYGDADEIVARVLSGGGTAHGDTFRAGDGYAADKLVTIAHPDIPGAEVWVQETVIPGFHFGEPDYWYAFAGDPWATPASTGTAMPFHDIAGSTFKNDILWLADRGITAGCAPYKFCPNGTVTRAQMASFLVRALGLKATSGTNLFSDDDGSAHEADIDRLATAGITAGCAPGKFCPNAAVTRAQMASFLVRALGFKAGAGANLFDDDNGSPHEGDIDRLATAGVTSGCASRAYCPNQSVTRGQMAAFLHRAFGD